LMNVEMKEHNLKKAPTKTELLKMEQREHKLGNRPTMRQAMEAEYAEHSNAEGKLVIKPSRAQEAKATAIYKRGK
jgi:hypothetical protein